MNSLENKIAVITGAGRGIGAATARLFAKEGAKCVLAARTEKEIKALASEIEQEGGKALSLVCDVSKDADVERLYHESIQAFTTIDILVNNAGGGKRNEVLDARLEDWDWMLNVNLRGAMLCAKVFLPPMIRPRKERLLISHLLLEFMDTKVAVLIVLQNLD